MFLAFRIIGYSVNTDYINNEKIINQVNYKFFVNLKQTDITNVKVMYASTKNVSK